MSTFVDINRNIIANDFNAIRRYDIIDDVNRRAASRWLCQQGRFMAYARTLSGVSIRTLINAHHDYVMHVVNSHDMDYSIAHMRNPNGKYTIRVPCFSVCFIVHMLLTIDSIESVASF